MKYLLDEVRLAFSHQLFGINIKKELIDLTKRVVHFIN